MKEATLIVNLDSVRFDDRLSAMARLFYAEVCGNVTVDNGCPVNDEYFAGLYHKTARQIRNLRRELKEYGYTKEYTDSLGFKYILPTKFDVEGQIDSLKIKKRVEVTYIAPDGRKLPNEEETFKYFHPLIENSSVPEKFKPNTIKFFNTFINALYDLEFYNKKFTDERFLTTKEFFQFVVQTIRPEEIYQKADYIFTERYSGIKQTTYYVIATIVGTYKDEFQSPARRRYLTAKRKLDEAAINKQSVIDDCEIKGKQRDLQQTAIKRKLMKAEQNKQILEGGNA